MPNVSSDINTFLRTANNSAARSALNVAGVYATVAALIADTSVSSLAAGDAVQVNGYYAAGDFGHPMTGVISASAGFDASITSGTFGTEVGTTGALSFPLQDGRYFLFYPIERVNAKWLGAKGDGYAEQSGTGSTSTDDRKAIQGMLNYLNSEYAKTRVGYFPKGVYSILTSIDIEETYATGKSLSVGKTYEVVNNGGGTMDLSAAGGSVGPSVGYSFTATGNYGDKVEVDYGSGGTLKTTYKVGLCVKWSNSFNNDPTSHDSSVSTNRTYGMRLEGDFGEIYDLKTSSSIIAYGGSTAIDALVYATGNILGWQGMEGLQLIGMDRRNGLAYEVNPDNLLSDPFATGKSAAAGGPGYAYASFQDPHDLIKVDYVYLQNPKTDVSLTNNQVFRNLIMERARLCVADFGGSFSSLWENIQIKNSLLDGLRLDGWTSINMRQVIVSTYFRYGFYLSGRMYYSTLESCVVEDWPSPNNPDFDEVDVNEDPWIQQPNVTQAEWVAVEARYGTNFYFDYEFGGTSVSMNGCGCEGSGLPFLYASKGSTISLDGSHIASGIGDRARVNILGQLNAGTAAVAQGASLTVSTAFNPTSTVSVGDIVAVGKVSSYTAAFTGWPSPYSDADNFVSSGGISTNYGQVIEVTGTTSNSITGTVLNEWSWNETAADWPSGTRSFDGTEYVGLLTLPTEPLIRLEAVDDSTFAYQYPRIILDATILTGNLGWTTGSSKIGSKVYTKLADTNAENGKAEINFSGTRFSTAYHTQNVGAINEENLRDYVYDPDYLDELIGDVRLTTNVNQSEVVQEAVNIVTESQAPAGVLFDGTGSGSAGEAGTFDKVIPIAGSAYTFVFKAKAPESPSYFFASTDNVGFSARSGIFMRVTTGGAIEIVMYQQSSGVNVYAQYNGGKVNFNEDFTVAISIDLSGTVSASSFKVYVNGVPVALTEVTAPTGTYNDASIISTTIGNSETTTKTITIYKTYIFDRILTASEVRRRYSRSAWVPATETNCVVQLEMDEQNGWQAHDKSDSQNHVALPDTAFVDWIYEANNPGKVESETATSGTEWLIGNRKTLPTGHIIESVYVYSAGTPTVSLGSDTGTPADIVASVALVAGWNVLTVAGAVSSTQKLVATSSTTDNLKWVVKYADEPYINA